MISSRFDSVIARVVNITRKYSEQDARTTRWTGNVLPSGVIRVTSRSILLERRSLSPFRTVEVWVGDIIIRDEDEEVFSIEEEDNEEEKDDPEEVRGLLHLSASRLDDMLLLNWHEKTDCQVEKN